jgi:hypothetical protein
VAAAPDAVAGDWELARFRAAAQAAFGIAPYLEDGATYVRRLRDNDRRRQERLEEDWHLEPAYRR